MAMREYRDTEIFTMRSWVSWGAIIAGVAVTMASMIILTVLGAAIGLSVGPEEEGFGMGAAIYTFLITLISLFLGGWTTSRFAIGNTSGEATIHGIILWGVVTTILLFFGFSGVQMGVNALGSLGGPQVAEQIAPGAVGRAPVNVDELRAVGIGVTPEQEQALRARAGQGGAGERPDQLAERAAPAAWWTLGALVVSLLVTIGGTLSTSGPGLPRRAPATATPPPSA